MTPGDSQVGEAGPPGATAQRIRSPSLHPGARTASASKAFLPVSGQLISRF